MKVITLSEAVEKLEKTEFPVKAKHDDNKVTPNYNLPQVRKVALAKRRVKFVMLVALFISCFSLSVFVGYFGPFLLFK